MLYMGYRIKVYIPLFRTKNQSVSVVGAGTFGAINGQGEMNFVHLTSLHPCPAGIGMIPNHCSSESQACVFAARYFEITRPALFLASSRHGFLFVVSS